MNRKEFLQSSLKSGIGCCAFFIADSGRMAAGEAAGQTDPSAQLKSEKVFVENWLTDLLDAMEGELDEKTRVKLIESCGRACFRRYQFKQDIARLGKNNLSKLLEAYRKNFEVWQEGDQVHIRYGAVSSGCYCPAARYRPAKTRDLHCECTRATHQTIFETALGRPLKVDVVESLRRGGTTCHFLIHLT